MKSLKLLFLVMAICFASGVKARINNSEVLFYIRVDANLKDPQTRVEVYRITNGILYDFRSGYNPTLEADPLALRTVCNNLKEDSYCYDNSNRWDSFNFRKYDANMSNDKWTVYAVSFEANPPLWYAHMNYKAFKNDFSEFMEWNEPDYDKIGRRIYKRITKNELKQLSFTGARDFLQ